MENTCVFLDDTSAGKLPMDSILTVLEDLARTKNAEPIDKSKHIWHIYCYTLEEWGNMIYSWIQNNGMLNTVCTFYELTEGENTVGEGIKNHFYLPYLLSYTWYMSKTHDTKSDEGAVV